MVNLKNIAQIVKPFAQSVYKSAIKNAKPILGGAAVTAVAGFFIGKKKVDDAYEKGYSDASAIYEEKFRKQTEEFLSGKKSIEQDLEGYKKLLGEYDAVISELEEKVNKCEAELAEMKILRDKRAELISLKKAV